MQFYFLMVFRGGLLFKITNDPASKKIAKHEKLPA